MKKKERRIRQTERAYRVMHLLSCFEYFYCMKAKEERLKYEIDYDTAEKLADSISCALNVDYSPTDFLCNKDSLSNEILDEYNLLQEELKHCIGYSKEDVISFLKYIYYNSFLLRLKVFDFLNFSEYCLSAAYREICVKELMSHCIEIEFYNVPAKIVDTQIFRKQFIQIEQDFERICCLRKERNNKKYESRGFNDRQLDICR